jgi:hypothetical protein
MAWRWIAGSPRLLCRLARSLCAQLSEMPSSSAAGRIGYYASACAPDPQSDFAALRTRIRRYDDLSREFWKAARRHELRAIERAASGHPTGARESSFTAAIPCGAAQWSIGANTDLNPLLDRKKTECYRSSIHHAGRVIEPLENPYGERTAPAYLHIPVGLEPKGLPCLRRARRVACPKT